jgi:chloramphenicol-sensitive protein RarD
MGTSLKPIQDSIPNATLEGNIEKSRMAQLLNRIGILTGILKCPCMPSIRIEEVLIEKTPSRPYKKSPRIEDTMKTTSSQLGITFAVLALSSWGLLPVYWKQLGAVPSLEVICHRAVWSVLFLLVFCSARGALGELITVAKNPQKLATLALTGALIASNWLAYVWGVTNGHLVEASLGYFLSPLVTVALGAVVLHEHLSAWKKFAVSLAAFGVLVKAISAGTMPWLGLCLAVSMSMYGFLRKQLGVSALVGLTLETVLLAPVALGYLSYLSLTGSSHFLSEGGVTTTLLLLTGVATSLPLIWFVRASQLLPLSTLGIMQYLSPTLQFLLAVVVYREKMGWMAYCSFSCIWVAIALYLASDVVRPAPKAEETPQRA